MTTTQDDTQRAISDAEQYTLDLNPKRIYFTAQCNYCKWQGSANRNDGAGFWHMIDVHTRQHCKLG